MLKLFCVLSLAFLVQAEVEYIKVPQSEMPKLLEASLKCIEETHVNADALQKIFTWSFKNSSNIRKFLYCFLNRAGYADNEGHLINTNILPLFGNHKQKDAVKTMLDECNKIDGKDKYDTLYKISSCCHDKSPIAFTI